jgi:hypothetical protein
MSILIPQETTFPFKIELKPERKILKYEDFWDLLMETGARIDEFIFDEGFVSKCIARLYTKEQAEAFLPKYFSIGHLLEYDISFSGDEISKKDPTLVYLIILEQNKILIV